LIEVLCNESKRKLVVIKKREGEVLSVAAVSPGCYNLQLDEDSIKICHYDESERVALMEEELHKNDLRINEEMEMGDSATLKRPSLADMRWNPCLGLIACWNMALNDQVTPPPKAWVNPCYWLTTWRETYSHKVGRPKKKIKRSKHEDEPFVKDGKLSKKRRTITCQSCGNIGHNKATCKGQGGNNAEASGSASRQAQQAEPAVGQDGEKTESMKAAPTVIAFANLSS
nr:hypothetical protein [Tanacetum cinerariifolium]